jgi:hypothetical protein
LDFLAAGKPSDVFNVGTGKGASVMEVLGLARETSGAPIDAQFAPRRPGDPAVVYADNRKARETLGWSPRYGLREIIDAKIEGREIAAPEVEAPPKVVNLMDALRKSLDSISATARKPAPMQAESRPAARKRARA